MGKMNLLKAGYTGTLGTTYGVKQRRIIYAKAKPFSHTPHNEVQKKSFTAFSKLQRFCSYVNKYYWKDLGLKDKDRNKMNVSAQFFKKMIVNHEFDFINVQNVVATTLDFTITKFEYIQEVQNFSVEMYIKEDLLEEENASLFLGVFTEDGTGIAVLRTENVTSSFELPTLFPNKSNAFLVAFFSCVRNGKRVLLYCAERNLKNDIVINSVWFCNNINNGRWYYEEVETLVGENVSCVVENETLGCAL